MKSKLLKVVILAATLGPAASWAQDSVADEVLLQVAEQKESVEGDLRAAIRIYEQVVSRKGAARPVVAKALLHIGGCYEKLGSAEAHKAYERVAQQYSDQAVAAAEAHKRLAALDSPARKSINGEMLLHRLPFSPDAFFVQSDGKVVVYVDAGSGDLVATDLAGAHKRILRRSGADASESAIFLPHLSPDGSKIAFTVDVGAHHNFAVMNTDGSGFHTILNGAAGTSYRVAGWTRDNTAVLITTMHSSGRRLIKVRESDGFVQQLADTGTRWVLWASYSPDGKFIAYSIVSREGIGLEMMAADGSQHEKLATQSNLNRFIDWTPDGKAILFSSDLSGSPALYRQDVAQGRPQGGPILIREGVASGTLTIGGSLIYRVDRGQSRVFVTKVDFEKGVLSGPPQAVSDLHSKGQWAPAWSPDGKKLAVGIHYADYIAQRGPSEILLIPLPAGEPRRIATSDGFVDIVWAPDGRSLYSAGPAREKGTVISRVSLDQGAVTGVLTVPQESMVENLQMSDDGRALLVTSLGEINRTARHTLVRYVLETREPFDVAKQEGFGAFSVSPDGRWIAASAFEAQVGSRSTLSIRAVNGGDWRQIVSLQEAGLINLLQWTPDGRSIVYAVRKGAPAVTSTGLFQIAFSGGAPRKLGDLPGRVDRISIHPDGSKLAFSSFGNKAELWMLENFLASKASVR